MSVRARTARTSGPSSGRDTGAPPSRGFPGGGPYSVSTATGVVGDRRAQIAARSTRDAPAIDISISLPSAHSSWVAVVAILVLGRRLHLPSRPWSPLPSRWTGNRRPTTALDSPSTPLNSTDNCPSRPARLLDASFSAMTELASVYSAGSGMVGVILPDATTLAATPATTSCT